MLRHSRTVLSLGTAALMGITSVFLVPPTPAEARPLYDNTKLGSFFTAQPRNLAKMRNGTLIRVRDVPNVLYPASRTLQFVFKTVNSHGKAVMASAAVVRPHNVRPNKPVMVYNDFINSLGVKCQPSFSFQALAYNTARGGKNTGYSGEIMGRNGVVQAVASQNARNGIITIFPDFLGLKSAYSANILGAHITLDAVRAVRSMKNMGIGRSPVVLSGYSGGGMVAAWAAAMAPRYAPRLRLAGLAAGGMPVDMVWMALAMGNHPNPGFGIAIASLLGMEREYPHRMNVYSRMNSRGKKKAQNSRNACTPRLLDYWKNESITSTMSNVIVKEQLSELRVFYENSLRNYSGVPRIPLYLWGSSNDVLVPLSQIKTVAKKWCRANPRLRIVTRDVGGTDHVSNFALGLPDALTWVEGRYAGRPAPNDFC